MSDHVIPYHLSLSHRVKPGVLTTVPSLLFPPPVLQPCLLPTFLLLSSIPPQGPPSWFPSTTVKGSIAQGHRAFCPLCLSSHVYVCCDLSSHPGLCSRVSLSISPPQDYCDPLLLALYLWFLSPTYFIVVKAAVTPVSLHCTQALWEEPCPFPPASPDLGKCLPCAIRGHLLAT
jgi:hypothetical protein